MEKFQGKECNVILVSTVRSYPKLTAHKQQVTIGFVDNEKVRSIAKTHNNWKAIFVQDFRCILHAPFRMLSSFHACTTIQRHFFNTCTLTKTLSSEVQRSIDPSTSLTDCGRRPESLENWTNLEQVRTHWSNSLSSFVRTNTYRIPTCLIKSLLFVDSSITARKKGVTVALQCLMERKRKKKKMHCQMYTQSDFGN